MNNVAKDILMHYGMPRRSGRYPWGSGEHPYQHSADFLARVEGLQKQGMSETEIAKIIGGELNDDHYSTARLRAQKAIAKAERRADMVATAKSMTEDGFGPTEIGRRLGVNESTVRSLLNEKSEERMNKAQTTAEYLKGIIDEKGILDVGKGVELELGISREKLEEALEILNTEGYPVYGRGIKQITNPGQQTNIKVLCPPGTEFKDIYADDVKINSVKDYNKILTENGTKIRPAFAYPESLDSKRLAINYAEDGGINKDGVIELRRGVEDISLGGSHYAQVRILVDGTHYLKGMAVYSDDLPDGVDVRFNTNKHRGTPMEKVLKEIKPDPDNPFGSLIKEAERGGQRYYDDPNGKYIDPVTGHKQSLSLINKRADEGDWGEWSDHLASQFLSKQNKTLITKQLNLALADKVKEFDEINSYTNPTVKKVLLKSFSDDCDAAAIHLQAAALPRQKYQVILPLTTIKDNEIYAPNYKAGEKVALIRYPHGGTFEIPILTVTAKNAEGKKVITNSALDAVGINSKVAERLSGADFDGDTVMVIPINKKINITSTPPLKGLEGFDPKEKYGPDSTSKPYKRMGKEQTQIEMGRISNLITDMTLQGASDDKIARAVRHSMVVIDANKHNLDYKRSEKENGISALRKEYQGRVEDGRYTESAATLISRAKGQKAVPKRQGSPIINEDGSLTWKTTTDLYYDEKKPVRKKDANGKYLKDKDGNYIYEVDPKTGKEIKEKTGKVIMRTQKSTQMAEAKDARSLSTGTLPEELYADYANHLKSLANQARKEYISTKSLEYSPSAKKTYSEEVESLDKKLKLAELNKPRERQAQIIAGSRAEAKIQSDPDLSKAEIKKINQQELVRARQEVGAKRNPIDITDKEWEAIQSGAITGTKLERILNFTDMDVIKEKAMPRNKRELSEAKQSYIKTLSRSGYTNEEIAEKLGVSTKTVQKYLK